MGTLPQPTIKAKYATVYDEPARIAKVNQVLYVIYDDGRIEDFSIEMAPFTVVLGDVAISELQAMWDRAWHATAGVLGRPQSSTVSTATGPLITGVDAGDTPYNPPSARSAGGGGS